MNREIKFRAWENNLKEIIPVEEINFNSIMINQNTAWRFIDEVELMQFTGLKDKNGTDIYEGDIVLDKYEEVKIVQWYEGQFVVTRQVLNGSGQRFEYNNINNLINHYSKFEVIGNIYEHPELLECDEEC